MAEKKSRKMDVKEKKKASAPVEADPAPKEVKEVAEKPAPAVAPPVLPLVSFVRWFKARSKERGFKPHWMKGMQSYANTSGRHTMDEWDQIFSKY
jgi:hypothetical protein